MLAVEVAKLGLTESIVLAVPRGGVPVGDEVAAVLGAPIDVVVARKIGAPGYPEYAIGAVSQDGDAYLDRSAIRTLGVAEEYLKEEMALKAEEIKERMKVYRGDRPYPDIRGKSVVVVDDGIATGSTVRVAIRSLRKKNPRLVVLATPVAPPEVVRELSQEADVVVCLSTPAAFSAVGEFYRDFSQLEDSDVISILRKRSPI